MLADSIDAREVDFSHLQLLHSRPPIIESTPRKLPLRYLFAGVAVSILCHALLLVLNLPAVQPVQPLATKLMIQLQQVATPDNLPAADRPTEPIVDAPQVPGKELPATPPPPEVDALPADVVIQPLSADELRSIIQGDDQSAIQSPGQAPASGIAANVFNPALRQRLQNEESKPEYQSVERGPKTYTDPSGATIVDLGGGKCLRSSVPKPGAAQNWYMTSCGGKSESEQMMERVNQEVRERFQ